MTEFVIWSPTISFFCDIIITKKGDFIMSVKVISIIVLTFMIATLLAGCGSNSTVGTNGESSLPENNSGNTSNSTNNPNVTEKGENSEADQYPDSDENDEQAPEDNSDVNIPGSDENDEQASEDNPDVNIPGGDENNEQIPEEKPNVNIPVGNEVGYKFKDVTLQTLDGSYINTADMRGKIIIFNVWATWCPPCMAELPDFNQVAEEYADDVVIVAVHTYDSGLANMPSYVESNFPDTKIIFAYDNASNEAYYSAGGIGYVPQTAIIDQNGIIHYSDSGKLSYDALTSWIKNLVVSS